MLRRTAGILLLLAAVCTVSACRRIEEPVVHNIPLQSIRGAASIPANWGHLVSVTTESTYPDLMQLWFEDNEGNVRMVIYRFRTGELLNVGLFPRQAGEKQ